MVAAKQKRPRRHNAPVRGEYSRRGVTYFTPEQWEMMEARALEEGRPVGELIRSACIIAGYCAGNFAAPRGTLSHRG